MENKYWNISSPITVHVEITDSCNERCRHCYNFSRPKGFVGKKISQENLDKLIEELIKNKVMHVIVTGGEPLLALDRAIYLIKKVKKAGMSVTFNSNLLSANSENMKKLKDSGIDHILTTLHSNKAEVHDFVANTPGAFNRIVNGIKIAQKEGIRVTVNTILFEYNQKDIYEIGKFVHSIGVKKFLVNRAIPSPTNKVSQEKEFVVDEENAKKMFKDLLRLKKDLGMEVGTCRTVPQCFFDNLEDYDDFLNRGCAAGKKHLGININGETHACVHELKSYGNIYDIGLKKCWENMAIWRTNEYIPEECQSCHLFGICDSGCRLVALNHTGSMKGFDNLRIGSEHLPKYNGGIKQEHIESAKMGTFTVHPEFDYRKEKGFIIARTRGARVDFIDEKFADILIKHHQNKEPIRLKDFGEGNIEKFAYWIKRSILIPVDKKDVQLEPLPDFSKIKLLVCDFDGVMTNNKVYVDENRKETVRCDRGDGLGIENYKKNGGEVLVISKEKNKVVRARCEKLGIRVFYGVDSKIDLFKQEVKKLNLTMQEVCYMGNDVNDLGCIEEAGIGVAVNDSHPEIKKIADYITEKNGGEGVVREICDLILNKKEGKIKLAESFTSESKVMYEKLYGEVKMKVLFINPSRGGQGYIPLNIPLLIAILKKNNHDVRLFDMSDYEIFDEKSYGKQTDSIFFKVAPFDNENVVEERKEFYKNNSNFNINGLDLKKSNYFTDFEKLLNDFKPDIIAVSCLSLDFKFISKFLLHFKKKYNLPVIFGGIHAILHPEETLNSGICDFICTGEGENSLLELLDVIKKNKSLEDVRGIWFKSNGQIIKNPPIHLTDLTCLPFPNFDDFDPIHFYRPFEGKKYKMVNYELSRGCPFNCSYCVNGTLREKYKGLGKFNRIKNINQSIKELKYLVNKYKFNFIRFWDDDFISITSDYLEEYASLYLKEINLPFLINARVDAITEKKIQILKEMGCVSISMGIEHGNEYIRKNIMNRNMSDETIIKNFNLVKSYGIRTSAYNIIGFPYETRETIFETIELNRNANPDGFSVNYIHPYKNIPIRKIFEKHGLNPNYEVTQNSEPHFIPKGMTYQELKGLKRNFPFYVLFPKDRWDEIKLAETDEQVYQKLQKEFTKLKK